MLSKFQLSGKQIDIVNEFKTIFPIKGLVKTEERSIIYAYERLLFPYLLEEIKKHYDVDYLKLEKVADRTTFLIQARCFTGDADDAMTYTFKFLFKGLNVENFFDMETRIEHNDNIFTVKPVEIGEAVLQEV